MICKIILKNFKSNLRNYLLFFFSEVLSVAMIFSAFGMKDILMSWSREGVVAYYLSIYIRTAIGIIVIINVFLMVFSVRYYVKTRLKDYGMFLVLGMRKKMILCSMLSEFGLGWAGSVALGIGFGYGITMIFKYIIAQLYSTSIYSTFITLETYKYSFVVSTAIMLLSVIVICIMIEERGISSLISSNERREKRIQGKWRVCGVLAGIALFIVSIMWFGLASYGGYNSSGEITIMVCAVAVFLILTFGGNIALDFLKKREGLYYKKLLNLNQFYHRYNSNLMIILMLFAIQMISLGNLAVEITDNIPVTPKDKWYPYDYVWFARQDDEEFAKILTAKYDGKESSIPVFRVTTIWATEHFGISEDSYEKITKHSISLTGKEVAFVAQARTDEVIGIEQDLRTERKRYPLHYGKKTEKLEYEFDRAALNLYTKDYIIKEMRRESVFGYFGNGWIDDTFVFSDEFFEEKWQEMTDDQEEPVWLIMMNIPVKNQKEFSKEMNQYIDQYGITNEAQYPGENMLYEAELTKEQKKAENILHVTINVFMMVLLYGGSIFIMGMKISSELDDFRRRYEFLNCMGMRHKELKKSIGGEILNVLSLPLVLSYVGCTIFMIRLFVVRNMSISEIGDFMKRYSIIVVIYLLVQIFSAWCMKCYLVRKVMSGISH